MKRRFQVFLAGVLGISLGAALCSVSFAAPPPTGQVYWASVQPANGVVPDGGCSKTSGLGFSLYGNVSFHAVAQCSDGSPITDGGLNGWYCSFNPMLDLGDGGWMPATTNTYCQLPVNGSVGAFPSLCPELTVTNPFGRFYFQTTGVTCSGSNPDSGILVGAERAQR
jgi:hypothetical protein